MGQDSQGQQKAKSDSVSQENVGHLRHSGLRTDIHSPRGRVGRVPRRHNLGSYEALTLPTDKSISRQGLKFPLSLHQIHLVPHMHTCWLV